MQGAGEGVWVDCGPRCHFPFRLELFREVSASLLEHEDAQSPGAENH